MMRSLRLGSMILAFLVVPMTAVAVDEVTVAELIETAAELTGNRVVVEGELVGDYGFRRDGWMWTQLNGDDYVQRPIREGGSQEGGNTGIGIRMPTALGLDLDPPGRYRNRGPVVRVTGIWKYHDEERQGESYLEVESLVVVESGRGFEQKPDWVVIVLGVFLFGASGVLWITRADKWRA